MPSQKIWKNPRIFHYEIDTGGNNGIIKSGIITANSVKEARTQARQITQETGYTWGKKWKTGWIQNAIEGTQGWIGDNDHEPTTLLWVYVRQ